MSDTDEQCQPTQGVSAPREQEGPSGLPTDAAAMRIAEALCNEWRETALSQKGKQS